MRLTPTCIACTLARRAAELEQLDIDNRKKLGIFRDLLDAVNLYIGPDIEVAVLESVVFRRFKTLLGGKNIYENLVKEKINAALTRANEIFEILKEKPLEEKLRLALYASALATGYNVLDAPEKVLLEPPGPADLALIGSSIKLGRDDSAKLIEYVKRLGESGGTVYYLFASVMELPYDKNVIKILVEDFGLGIVGVVRGARYRDFAIAEDLENYGLIEYVSEVLDMGSDSLTVTKDEHPHIYDQLNEASLVFIKSSEQAIYFHNNPLKSPNVLIFMAPCSVVAKAFGVPIKSLNIIVQNIEESQSG